MSTKSETINGRTVTQYTDEIWHNGTFYNEKPTMQFSSKISKITYNSNNNSLSFKYSLSTEATYSGSYFQKPYRARLGYCWGTSTTNIVGAHWVLSGISGSGGGLSESGSGTITISNVSSSYNIYICIDSACSCHGGSSKEDGWYKYRGAGDKHTLKLIACGDIKESGSPPKPNISVSPTEPVIGTDTITASTTTSGATVTYKYKHYNNTEYESDYIDSNSSSKTSSPTSGNKIVLAAYRSKIVNNMYETPTSYSSEVIATTKLATPVFSFRVGSTIRGSMSAGENVTVVAINRKNIQRTNYNHWEANPPGSAGWASWSNGSALHIPGNYKFRTYASYSAGSGYTGYVNSNKGTSGYFTVIGCPQGMSSSFVSFYKEGNGSSKSAINIKDIIPLTYTVSAEWGSFPITSHKGNFNKYKFEIIDSSEGGSIGTSRYSVLGTNTPSTSNSKQVDLQPLSVGSQAVLTPGNWYRIKITCYYTYDGTNYMTSDNTNIFYSNQFRLVGNPNPPELIFPCSSTSESTTTGITYSHSPLVVVKLTNPDYLTPSTSIINSAVTRGSNRYEWSITDNSRSGEVSYASVTCSPGSPYLSQNCLVSVTSVSGGVYVALRIPNISAGDHPITVECSNDYGSSSRTFTITRRHNVYTQQNQVMKQTDSNASNGDITKLKESLKGQVSGYYKVAYLTNNMTTYNNLNSSIDNTGDFVGNLLYHDKNKVNGIAHSALSSWITSMISLSNSLSSVASTTVYSDDYETTNEFNPVKFRSKVYTSMLPYSINYDTITYEYNNSTLTVKSGSKTLITIPVSDPSSYGLSTNGTVITRSVKKTTKIFTTNHQDKITRTDSSVDNSREGAVIDNLVELIRYLL